MTESNRLGSRPCRIGLLFLVALLATVVLGWLRPTLAQTPPTVPTIPPQTSPTTTTPQAAPEPTVSVPDIRVQLDDLKARQERIDEQQNNDRNLLYFVFGAGALLVGLLTAGGVVGIITSLRTDNRAGQLHALSVAGESASQARTEQVHASFLDASQKTLGLVNDTLQLAKEASERAVTTMSDKARRRLQSLDRRAQDVIRDALLKGDLKYLVSAPEATNPILEIANELQAIEGFLALQDIELTSACFFVRGMERHLHQEPEAAVSHLWQSLEEEPEEGLEDLAYYWIGYEYNNLGRHEEAANTFKRAIARGGRSDDASPARYELRRIELESRFFHYGRSLTLGKDSSEALRAAIPQVEGLAAELADLCTEVKEKGKGALHGTESAILNTLANVMTWRMEAAHALGDAGLAPPGGWNEVVEVYGDAVTLAEKGGSAPWFVRFGLLEATANCNPGTPPVPTEYQRVEDLVQRAIPSRYEPRSLVLLQQTRLICIFRRRGSVDQLASAMQDLQKELRPVRPEVTLYSQRRKCNVSRNEFEVELQSRFQEFRAELLSPTNGFSQGPGIEGGDLPHA